MIKHITLRTSRRTTARTSVAALVVTLLAIAFLEFSLGTPKAEAANETCSTSGTGSRTCSTNLSNSNLLSQRSFPSSLYRGDSRAPYSIFRNGFSARGGNNDIVAHVQGDRAGNSNYVSTTGTYGIATSFAQSQGLRNLESAARTRCAQVRAVNDARRGWISRIFPSRCDGVNTVTAETYVYDIDPRYGRNAVYVPDQIRGNANLYNHYASQDEWAYIHRIPREAIRGVHIYRLTAQTVRTNGELINVSTISRPRYDRYLINPDYGSVTVTYNPGNDTNSHFSYSSHLNIPRIAANPYTRGCSAINYCRR